MTIYNYNTICYRDFIVNRKRNLAVIFLGKGGSTKLCNTRHSHMQMNSNFPYIKKGDPKISFV